MGQDGGRGVGGSETGAVDRAGGDGGQLCGVRVQQDVLAGDGLQDVGGRVEWECGGHEDDD